MTSSLSTPILDRYNAMEEKISDDNNGSTAIQNEFASIFEEAIKAPGLLGVLQRLAILIDVSAFEEGGLQQRLAASTFEALKSLIQAQTTATASPA